MLYRACDDNVFLNVDKYERKTEGGLFIPDTALSSGYGKDVLSATVFDVGPGCIHDGNEWTVDVRVGDRVLIKRLSGDPVFVGDDILCSSAPGRKPGDEIRVVRNDAILCIIEEVQ